MSLQAFLSAAAASTLALSALAQPADAAITFERADAGLVAGSVAVAVGTDGALAGAAQAVDAASGGAVARAIASAKFKGGQSDALTLYAIGPFDRVALIGVGGGLTSAAQLEDFGGRAAAALGEAGGKIATPDAKDIPDDAAHVAFGADLRNYSFAKWTAEPKAAPNLTVLSADPAASAAQWRGLSAVAEGVAFARDLISAPSNVKTPEWFAAQVREEARGVRNLSVEVLDVPAMQRLGMGALLSVGQGSPRPPRMVIVRYRGAASDVAPIAFVGKGITFDSGGLSLKEPAGMWRMRYDMSGAAASVATVIALAKRGAAVNAVGIGAMAENMPDGAAARPGDIVTSMSGKTIEILNTDAEGRMVLADGITYAQRKEGARTVITIATLTGSARAALGDDYGGLITRDEPLAADLTRAGDVAGEPLWRLPAHDTTSKAIQATVADLRNVVEGGAEPGASIGGAFLMEFAEPNVRFAHLDIAGVAWQDAATPTAPAGAIGYGVRLFDRFVRDTAETK